MGAGPAGSLAALVLARGGAKVALVDKAAFPRDKACGDLVGPRGVQVLDDLGIGVEGLPVGDMEVVGPSGRRVILRATAGLTYPGHGVAVPRRVFDDLLRRAALDAGAEDVTGRADAPRFSDAGSLKGFRVNGAANRTVDLDADLVVGADGALSRVAAAAGLVEESRVLWGFAIRGYVASAPPLPQILFWEPARWEGYPGYGWVFPGEDDLANVGVGVGVRGDRRAGTRATHDLESFVSAVRPGTEIAGRTLGGWLKMGMVGTTPARGRVLLVGDAAGLVNSLQGEGISQALVSGRAAAEAVLAGPASAAERYRAWLRDGYATYAASTAPVTAAMVRRPKVVAAVGRLLTAPGVGRLVAGGWAVYWNDLLEGARPGMSRSVAAFADRSARLASARSTDRRCVLDSVAACRAVAGSGPGAA